MKVLFNWIFVSLTGDIYKKDDDCKDEFVDKIFEAATKASEKYSACPADPAPKFQNFTGATGIQAMFSNATSPAQKESDTFTLIDDNNTEYLHFLREDHTCHTPRMLLIRLEFGREIEVFSKTGITFGDLGAKNTSNSGDLISASSVQHPIDDSHPENIQEKTNNAIMVTDYATMKSKTPEDRVNVFVELIKDQHPFELSGIDFPQLVQNGINGYANISSKNAHDPSQKSTARISALSKSFELQVGYETYRYTLIRIPDFEEIENRNTMEIQKLNYQTGKKEIIGHLPKLVFSDFDSLVRI